MRITERLWLKITPQLLTANGTNKGLITLADTSSFRVKQKIRLKSLTQDSGDNNLEIKQIISKTQMFVGKIGGIALREDVSIFLTTDLTSIQALEQARPSLDPVNVARSAFEEEPILAHRNVLVDKYGDKYTIDNPFPVQLTDGSINIGTVNAELEVQLSHAPKPNGNPGDSVRLGDGVDYFGSTINGGKRSLDVNVTTPNLDIRDLVFATDKVDVSGSSVSVNNFPIEPTIKNIYNEVSSVASGTLTSIVSFTATQNTRLKQVDISGENIATYEVLVNGNLISKKRTYFGGSLDLSFSFDKGLTFISGQQVLVRVIHNRPTPANFNANIIVIEG